MKNDIILKRKNRMIDRRTKTGIEKKMQFMLAGGFFESLLVVGLFKCH